LLDLFRVAKHPEPERITVHQLARPFGGETGDHTDKFTDTPWHPGSGWSPILDETCLVRRSHGGPD
jgi:hypothetical protein